MNSTTYSILALLVPLIVAALGGWIAYRQALRVADRNARSEGKRIDLDGLVALNHGLSDEVKRLTERTEQLETKEQQASVRIGELERTLADYVTWARQVIRILRQPDVTSLLRANAVVIPDPPAEPGIYAE